ncbi:uncharacterized protein LOC128871657 isoform X2 [Anastrepha ludens]|uniref:uncharacterized protein LOC128871657 isoform X2 n=1 Tax=Anastrepha ludens TaxID=28586 RepID=UPI0023B1B648|nr:uncharacterized protein LOC128871657 isoform X2 [Anastrepha ludens]
MKRSAESEMNSVDGAPNATILAEGAPTIATVTSRETTNNATTTIVSAKTTELTTTTTNVIKTTDADATDEFHESDKNVQVVVVVVGEEQLRQQQQRNEAPIIITTKSETEAITIETAATTSTMGNTKNKTNIETADSTAAVAGTTATATATAAPARTSTSEIITNIKDTEASDVQMTDMATPEGNGDGKSNGSGDTTVQEAAATSATTATATATAAVVIDNTTDTKPQPQPLLTAEGDNWEFNEMELCRCCGKPNVTLYDLFPNTIADDNSIVAKGNAIETPDAENTEAQVMAQESVRRLAAENNDVNQEIACNVVDDAKNGAQIKHKTATDAPTVSPLIVTSAATSKDTTKSGISTKIDANASNTPKRCYRTIAASIAAAAASTVTTSITDAISDAPTCQKISDPVVAAPDGGGVDIVEGERLAAGTSVVARVKKSATDVVAATKENSAAAAAPKNTEANNANGQGQSSDNMENILQEMQIWQLRVSLKTTNTNYDLKDYKAIQ